MFLWNLLPHVLLFAPTEELHWVGPAPPQTSIKFPAPDAGEWPG